MPVLRACTVLRTTHTSLQRPWIDWGLLNRLATWAYPAPRPIAGYSDADALFLRVLVSLIETVHVDSEHRINLHQVITQIPHRHRVLLAGAISRALRYRIPADRATWHYRDRRTNGRHRDLAEGTRASLTTPNTIILSTLRELPPGLLSPLTDDITAALTKPGAPTLTHHQDGPGRRPRHRAAGPSYPTPGRGP